MKVFQAIMLAAALAAVAPAHARGPEKAVPSPAARKEFEGFITKFRAAVKADDSAAVVGMTRLPFGPHADAAQFRAKAYPSLFTAKNRTCIQRGKAVYGRDGNKDDTYAIFCGRLIFTFTKTPAGFLFTDADEAD